MVERKPGPTRPDVLLSDIGMPDEDGYALIAKVRALAGDVAQVPAAALTAFARREDAARAIAAGFQRHIAKPVDPAGLARVVAELAGRARPAADADANANAVAAIGIDEPSSS